MTGSLDIKEVRAAFPSLLQPQVYLDNAGGSQTLGTVIDSIHQYLTTTNVQLGATYDICKQSTNLYRDGVKAAASFINAGVSEVVLGGSTTQLLHNLSFALNLSPGDELIVSNLDHEANIAAWVDLAEEKELTLKWWSSSHSTNPTLTPESLAPLLSEKTRLVTCTHTSNILGTIHDIPPLADLVHKYPRALFCVDGVAYAPHRQVDVKALGVDFYVLSWYKIYGPHISMLYAHERVLPQIRSLGHFFNPSVTLEDKLGLAAANYELTQSLPHVASYLGTGSNSRWAAIAEHEGKIQKIVLDYLNSREDVTVFGDTSTDPNIRVPVISFSVEGHTNDSVVEGVIKCSPYAPRWGHMYSKRLVSDVLGRGDEGVIRISLVHYNSEEEMHGLVAILDKVLGPAKSA